MLHVCFSAVELVCGNVYCWKCRDYIYDSRIDAVMKEVEQTLKGRQVSGDNACMSVLPYSPFIDNIHNPLHTALSPWKPNYVTWEPSNEEMSLLRENPKRRKVELDSSVGKNKHVCNSHAMPETVTTCLSNHNRIYNVTPDMSLVGIHLNKHNTR